MPAVARTVRATTIRTEDIDMPRYVIERTFAEGLHIPLTDDGVNASVQLEPGSLQGMPDAPAH